MNPKAELVWYWQLVYIFSLEVGGPITILKILVVIYPKTLLPVSEMTVYSSTYTTTTWLNYL